MVALELSVKTCPFREQFIKDKDLRIVGDTTFGRYYPLFKLRFLKRNEVLIHIE